MRLAVVVVLLLSMASQCSAQRSDSTIARIERQGYSVSTNFGKAVPPFLAFKLTPTGGLTISAPMPIYYFDNRGQMLPGCPYEYLMLRTELAELVVHGFEADGIELGFESEVPDAAFELEHLQLGAGQHGGKEMGACAAGVLVGALPMDAFCLSDLWYSSTQKA